MSTETALALHYETVCQTHGSAFSELFEMAVRLTGWPVTVAFAIVARAFPLEFDLFCSRALTESTRPKHADRWHFTSRPDLN